MGYILLIDLPDAGHISVDMLLFVVLGILRQIQQVRAANIYALHISTEIQK